MEVNLDEAATNLSNLIERARSGDEIIIAKAGTPMVRLVPVEPRPRPIFGSAKGSITFKEGWDAPMTNAEVDEFIGELSSGSANGA